MAAAQQVYAERSQIEQAYQAETARVAELAKAAADHTERGEFETAERARLEAQKHIARQRQLEQAHQYLQQAQQQPQTAEVDWTRPWSNAETEAFLKGRTKPTADWVRARPEFARDPEFRDKVTAADSYATKLRGIERDGGACFREIERQIGLRGDDDGGDGDCAYEPTPSRSPTTSASSSTSRSSPAYAAPVSHLSRGLGSRDRSRRAEERGRRRGREEAPLEIASLRLVLTGP